MTTNCLYDYDVAIIGGGVVGMTMALILAQQQPSLQIVLLDAQDYLPAFDKTGRVSALSLASQRIFQRLGCWDAMTARGASRYKAMQIWDEISGTHLGFNCQDASVHALGYIVEDAVLRECLSQQLKEQGNIHWFYPIKLCHMLEKTNAIELTDETDKKISVKMVIGADGSDSWVRTQAHIEISTWPYPHTAIVTTVKTTNPHQATAWQKFLKTGPLAFLPLQDQFACAIVWSAESERATQLMQMNDMEFKIALEQAFEYTLGDIDAVGPRTAFNLKMRHAKQYIKNRLALIGDAAHTIHPLAGQGINMGLLDAATLAEIMQDAQHKQRDFTQLTTLRKYERWRKSDNQVMLTMVNLLQRAFSFDSKPLHTLLSLGLQFTDNIKFIKNFFINYAVGNREHLPKIARRYRRP